jgi:hypothetical protein
VQNAGVLWTEYRAQLVGPPQLLAGKARAQGPRAPPPGPHRRAEGVLPSVTVQEPALSFPPTFVGSSARLPLTLSNAAPVPAVLLLDLTALPEFELLLHRGFFGGWGAAGLRRRGARDGTELRGLSSQERLFAVQQASRWGQAVAGSSPRRVTAARVCERDS